MNRTFTLLFSALLILLLGTSSSIMRYSTGIAGFTGAPGEATCATPGCHFGGSSSASSVTITSVPSFSNNQYMADSTYQITIAVNAVGFNRYGFGCEILDTLSANAGTMQTAGAGVKFLNSGARRNATHTTPKLGTGGTSFSFNWIAPSSGKATFYVCANAVNFNNNTSGDLPIPHSMFLYPAPVPVDTPVVIDNVHERLYSKLMLRVFPNPAASVSQLDYQLAQSAAVMVSLVDLQGKTLKVFIDEKQDAGPHSNLLDLRGVSAGVYFLRLDANGKKLSQKLLTVE